MRRPVVALVLLAAALPVCLLAQQPAFKSGVELVRIPVNLTQGDKPVEPGVVSAADFRILEEGVEQKVEFFQRESLPLSVCVVFDASGSMRGSTGETGLSALREVLTRLLPEDEVSVIAFAAAPEVVAPWTPAPAILTRVATLMARGSTSLNDAVLKAFELMDTATNPRPVVLMITDGGENTSRTSASQIVKTRRQGEAQVYAFNLVSPMLTRTVAPSGGGGYVDPQGPGGGAPGGGMPDGDVNVLERLVNDSGGVAYRVSNGTNAASLAAAFVDDLRFQYTIGYTPSKALDGKYRRIKVEMKKRGFKIRHRGGYLAMPSAPQP